MKVRLGVHTEVRRRWGGPSPQVWPQVTVGQIQQVHMGSGHPRGMSASCRLRRKLQVTGVPGPEGNKTFLASQPPQTLVAGGVVVTTVY